ncbi:hypothetical protein HHE02_05730 [Helicobacter heilmannii]|uniref:hypothetical protein n=1 Tax=Helicobacter heilmannii TaxID=35817 RepID=UPI0006A0EB11|nr:hypothetical protein [Helicobacter heilmannii]CRF47285.1 hypothetical protein HHE02_05730 [Helicobacter heilmannii]CRF48761.1 hypothetical protein HHE03_03350 [Helicobacter heilmannii]CRF51648.1 hypothetical protein HHE06_15360 [Helicobacter heilmannii]
MIRAKLKASVSWVLNPFRKYFTSKALRKMEQSAILSAQILSLQHRQLYMGVGG